MKKIFVVKKKPAPVVLVRQQVKVAGKRVDEVVWGIKK